uniref:Homeobox domain-containing protein n=1 Tax=Timema shepardi TaxID=629360 RepID=A0A7R9AVS3_TIMSH|nr:unnamed protein product [Timema shepardi]
MRTSFDPELELPKLQRWFAENQHPSRQQIQHYVKELNGLESRRGRKPLDVNNVVYWFKNARAAQKRAELRSIGPGMSCHLSLNGYSSNSHSPPNSGAGILIGQDSLMGESRLLQPTLKCSSPPTRSPTRGPLFLSNHHSDNSNDVGQMSDQDYEEDRLVDGRLEHRDFRDEIRGDPRDDIRNRTEMNDGRDTGSPVAPLSLTTNDKERTSNLSKQYKTVEDDTKDVWGDAEVVLG